MINIFYLISARLGLVYICDTQYDFASVWLLLLMRVTEKNPETKSIYGCGK